ARPPPRPGEARDNFPPHPGGQQRYVVKFAHLRADPAVVDVQGRVLRHIEENAPGLPVPRVLPTTSGRSWAVGRGGAGAGRVVHALSPLDGLLLRSVTTDRPLRR